MSQLKGRSPLWIDPFVALQCVGLVEALATGVTFEGLFPGVYSHMPLQITRDCEALVAKLTVIGPFSRVNHLVHLQTVSAVETPSALLTGERAHVAVETLVIPQQLFQSEAFSTDITGVWPLPWGWTRVKMSEQC